jgi:ATP-binding cassette subfamily C protein CydC
MEARVADLWTFLGLMRPRIGWVLTGLITSLLTTAAGIVMMGLVGGLVIGGGTLLTVGVAGIVLRALALFRGGGRYFEKIATHQATFRVIADLRVWFFERAIPLAPGRLGGVRSGDLLSRMVSDIDALDGLYLQILVPSVVALILAIPVGWILADVAPAVSGLALSMLLVAGIVIPAIAERLGRGAGRRQLAQTAALRVASVDLVQGIGDLLANQADVRHARHLSAIERERDRAGLTAAIVSAVSAAFSQALGQGTVILVVALGALAIGTGRADAQAVGIAAFVALAAFEAVAPLPFAYQMLGRTRAAARRILEIADAPPPVIEAASPEQAPSGTALSLDGVTFRYPQAVSGHRAENAQSPASVQNPALDHVSLDLHEGERVALVGPSGAGKSTLISLILRSQDPDAGSISLGGRDLKLWRLADLHRRVGVLSQNSPILAGTLRENLTIADPDADDARLTEVLGACGLSAFLTGLPKGLDTWLGETGARVSGGQARRIALARVILKDAPVLLLDEPTEGLDAETERALLDSLRPLVEGRTVLIISHRTAPTDLAHRVVRMEGGRLLAATSVPDTGPSDTP